MLADNNVIFKGKKDGILILLDGRVDFDELTESLQKKMLSARKFFDGAVTSITFKGRDLSEEEEYTLIDIIKKETNLNITFVNDGSGKKTPALMEGVGNEPHGLSPEDEQMTYYHRGTLRSGRSIRYPGSVVVIGDVNPGGEIIAEGSIVVLGTLKGLVHAGCAGNSDCFVTALKLLPTQLRISDIITYIPEEKKSRNKQSPAYAFIQDGQIYIAPLIV